jgi:hypothetical protein
VGMWGDPASLWQLAGVVGIECSRSCPLGLTVPQPFTGHSGS